MEQFCIPNAQTYFTTVECVRHIMVGLDEIVALFTNLLIRVSSPDVDVINVIT